MPYCSSGFSPCSHCHAIFNCCDVLRSDVVGRRVLAAAGIAAVGRATRSVGTGPAGAASADATMRQASAPFRHFMLELQMRPPCRAAVTVAGLTQRAEVTRRHGRASSAGSARKRLRPPPVAAMPEGRREIEPQYRLQVDPSQPNSRTRPDAPRRSNRVAATARSRRAADSWERASRRRILLTVRRLERRRRCLQTGVREPCGPTCADC